MNRIEKLFSLKEKNVLSIYFTAGFPRLNDTGEILFALQKYGADMVEIGMPYSDPLADGPVIQHSSMTAIHNGITIKLLFEQSGAYEIKRGCKIELRNFRVSSSILTEFSIALINAVPIIAPDACLQASENVL